MAGSKITVFANARAQQIDPTWRIGDLADHFKLNRATVLVEHNGEALLRDEWPMRPLQHGDRVEFIRVVAGG